MAKINPMYGVLTVDEVISSLESYILRLEKRIFQLEEAFVEYVLLGGGDYAVQFKQKRAEEVKKVDEAAFWDLEH